MQAVVAREKERAVHTGGGCVLCAVVCGCVLCDVCCMMYAVNYCCHFPSPFPVLLLFPLMQFEWSDNMDNQDGIRYRRRSHDGYVVRCTWYIVKRVIGYHTLYPARLLLSPPVFPRHRLCDECLFHCIINRF